MLLSDGNEVPETLSVGGDRLFQVSPIMGMIIDASIIGALVLIAVGVVFQPIVADTPAMISWAAQAPIVAASFAALGFCVVAMSHLRGHYAHPVPSQSAMRQLSGAGIYAFFVSTAIIMVSDAPEKVRFTPVVWLIIPTAIFGVRRIVSGLTRRRIVIAGSGPNVQHVTAAVHSDWLNAYEVAGVIDLGLFVAQARALDSSSAFPAQSILKMFRADSMIVSLHGCDSGIREQALDLLAHETAPVALVADLGDLQVQGCETHYFMSHPLMIVSFGNGLGQPVRRALKTLFDRVGAIFITIALLPVFALVAVLVALDGGPVLFRQDRVGQNGRSFKILKFRSMVVQSDDVLANTLATDGEAAAEWARIRKLRSDPRVTRLGRFLRRTSLDELPQLINVVRGDMSLVGPRPIVEAEVAAYGKEIRLYHRVKPGITGLWQVSGRSNTTYDQRVALDSWYVKNWSMWHDIVILIKTVPALLKRDGAV
jgi:Undecaprenyl-phosphate galactose phosphotransferase WbaP